MKYFVILLVLIGAMGTAYAESQVVLTPFDVYLSKDDFTTQGPNHNILVLNKGNSTAVNVYVKNNDDLPHKITLSSPTDSNSSTFSMFEFKPPEILVLPHETNSAKLHITVSNNTDTHSTFITFLGQSDVFGMKGMGFYLVVDDDFVQWTDYSLRAGLPGPAFQHLITDISEENAEKMISNGLGTPRYLPQEYQFRGMTDWGDSQQFVYSKSPVSNQTESMQFWKEDGMMIFYGVDGPNVNNTKSLPFKIAQDESQQIMVNGLLGTVTEQTTRKVMESDITYKVPSDLYLFDDAEKFSVSINANFPLEEIVKVAASISKVSSDPDKSDVIDAEGTDDVSIWVDESNYRFIDFPYAYTIGESIKFILETPRDRNCNSYDAKITDEDGNFILGWGKEISCDPTHFSNSAPYQTKIGYDEYRPIIINDSGKYYLEIEFENVFIKQEFVVRQNHSGMSLDRTVYPVPQMGEPPLKQFKSGIKIDEIQCKEGLVLVFKQDDSPACVNHDTIPKLIQRGWIDVDPRLQAEKKIPKFLCELYGGGFFDGTGECMDLESEYKCKMLGGVWNGKCIVPELVGMGIGTEPDPNPVPEPESESYDETKLRNAKKALETAYDEKVNLGNFYIKDVIVGYGTYDNRLVIDIPARFMEPDSIKTIKQDVRSIIGDDVAVDYVLYDEPIERHIETAIPYLWNQILNKNGIEYLAKEQTYWNNADGFHNPDRVCSPIIASNGTEFYISSTFGLEPFQITGTFIGKEKPADCHKIWRTDIIMVEPDRVTTLWLKNQDVRK